MSADLSRGGGWRGFRRLCLLLSLLSTAPTAGLLAQGIPPQPGFLITTTTNSYTASSDDFANPERGFYLHTETWASRHAPLSRTLERARTESWPDPHHTYTAKITLLLRLFYLDSFIAAPISGSFLNAIEADFDAARAMGFKLILRFAYNTDTTRPFQEPTKARILEHIAQLKPLLHRHRDVIAVLQHGFIGAWGEGYYTDVFSRAGQAFTAQDWTNRAEVLSALLNASPAERMVQVRVPQYKQKFVHGVRAPTDAPALGMRFRPVDRRAWRIGFHNDCFLADATDMGTFSDYDGVTDSADVAKLRDYLAQDTRYVAMGGETCAEFPPADDCASAGGRADSDMAWFHYSYLHLGWNPNVNDDWVGQGCLETIQRRLGYRLQLVSGVFPDTARPGDTLRVDLTFLNTGFAAPFNPRGAELMLRHTARGQLRYAELSRDTDLRAWLPGTNHTLGATLSLPEDLPVGDYELFLHLPDPAATLYGRVPYSLRLANAEALASNGAVLGTLWDPATGYHRLSHTVKVDTVGWPLPPRVAGLIPVVDFSAFLMNYDGWRARYFAGTTAEGEPEADADDDGRSNLTEYAFGSDPTKADGASPLRLSWNEGMLSLTLFKPPGRKDVRYEVAAAPDLHPASWTNQVCCLEDTPAGLRVHYNGASAGGFVRLRTLLDR